MEKDILINDLKKILERDEPETIGIFGTKFFLLSKKEIKGIIDILENQCNEERQTNKKCLIINSQFSWILKVDGEEIPFQGSYNKDYFINHYKSLGYEVEMSDYNN